MANPTYALQVQSLCVAGIGPMPMTRGGTPAAAPPAIRASGIRP